MIERDLDVDNTEMDNLVSRKRMLD